MPLGLGQSLTKSVVDPYNMYRSNRCVRFDGTDDYMVVYNSSTFDHIAGANDSQFTIACWFKLDVLPSLISQSATLISKTDNNASHQGADKREFILTIGHSADRINLVLSEDGTGTTDEWSHNVIGPAITDTKWHHVMVSYNGDPDQTITGWIDGVSQTVTKDSTMDANYAKIGAGDAWETDRTANVHIGAYKSTNYAGHMTGYIADPIYLNRKVGGGSMAKYFYNNGRPRNLSRYEGFSEASDTGGVHREAYWQMGDNKLDAFNKHSSGINYSANDETGFIVDASEAALNSTDVLNGAGSFSSASGWTLAVTDSNNQATIDTSAGTLRIQQTTGSEYIDAVYDNCLVVDKYYEIKFTVTADNGGAIRVLPRSGGQNQTDYSNIDATGTYTIYYKAEKTGIAIGRHTAGSTDMTISNLTIKEITSGDVAHFRNMRTGIVNESPGLGRDSYSYSFDGTNDHIQIPDNSSLDFGTNDFSITGWVKTTDTSAKIINKWAGGTGGFFVFVSSDGLFRARIDDGGATANTDYVVNSATTTINDGEWHHFAVVFDRSTDMRIYTDGVLERTDTNIPSVGNIDTSLDCFIGCNNSGSEDFAGNISDIAIYNKALTIAEVRENMGPGLDLNSLSTTGNIVAWWRFGDGQFDYQRVSYHTVGCLGDENNATLGSDVLGGNGDFSDPSYWTVSNGHSVVEDGKGKFLGTGTYGPIYKEGILTANQMYEITLDVESNDGGEDGTGRVTLNYGDDWYPKLCDNGGTGTGIKTYFMPNDTDLMLYAPNTGGTDYSSKITIDNVVVRPVNGIPGIMKNMAPEDIEKDAP